jgi:hypothetical protein
MTKSHPGRSESGMLTAEYAVGTIAACSLAGVCLYPVVYSPWVRDLLATLVRGLLAPWS